MQIEIYINNRIITDYSPEELAKIKAALTEKAMQSAGYEKEGKKGKA